MLSLNINKSELFEWSDKVFLPLGIPHNLLNTTNRQQLEKKLSGNSQLKPISTWGTLGWKNDEHFKPEGVIEFSRKGNLTSEGSTLKEIQNIWDFNPLSREKDFRVKERFINFDKLDFKFSKTNFDYDDLPMLRLTLFLDPDEGAMVYYQHSEKQNFNSTQANIEYILPQRTDEDYSTDRDRLHYYFPIVTNGITEFDDNSGKLILLDKSKDTSFIVKILTFKRNNLPAKALYNEASNSINLWTSAKSKVDSIKASISVEQKKKIPGHSISLIGTKKYAILKYDELLDQFVCSDKEQIDPAKKTLLLLHGTFSNTSGSYGKLYNNSRSLLKRMIKHGIFEQIISFDHPTVTHDAFQNSQILYRLIQGFRFEQSVDILSYSRGALLAKWLASDKDNKLFKTANIMTFSGANGVGYYKSGKFVAKGLSILRKLIPGPTSKLIASLAQFSAEFFLELPGNQQMTPENERLLKILKAKLINPRTRVQTIAADWNKSLITHPIKRPFARVMDGVIKLILGPKHDWVVGFREQEISPDSIDNTIQITSMHVKNFDLEYVKTNTHEIIYNYFKLKRQVRVPAL